MSHHADSYELDYVLWIKKQAQRPRAGRLQEFEVAHLTKELAVMAGKERRELQSRLILLLVQLLKCRDHPDRNTYSSLATLGEQRTQIALQLEDSPSLGLRLIEYADQGYPSAVIRAALATGIDTSRFPALNPYAINEMLDLAFIP